MYWILQVSDPLNKFRGIKKKVVFFYIYLGTKSCPFGLLLLNKMLQAYVCWGRSMYYWKHLRISSIVWWRWCDVNSIVWKNVQPAQFSFLFVQFDSVFFVCFLSFFFTLDFYFLFFTSYLSIMFSGNRKQTQHQQAWIVPL